MVQEKTGPNEIKALISQAGEDFLGFNVKPWTLEQLINIAPFIQMLVQDLQTRNISLDSLEGIFKDSDDPNDIDLSAGVGLIQSILPHLPQFISISIGVPVEEVKSFDGVQAITLGLKVISTNMENVVRFFDQLMGEAKKLKRTK